MIETPQIVQTAPQHSASLRLTVPREEIRQVMGTGLREVSAAVAAQRLTSSGP